MITRLKLKQPPTKKPVVELAVGGWIGKRFRAAHWGGTTIPLPFFVLILYWATPDAPMPSPWVRFHEFIHVRQDEEESCFLGSWFEYLYELFAPIPNKFWLLLHPQLWYSAFMISYAAHPMEREAYELTAQMSNSGTVPGWLM